MYIGRIVESIREVDIFGKTTFFIVSDHGFVRVDQKFSPNVALANEGLITLDRRGRATSWRAVAWPAGGSCAIVARDADDRNTVARIQAVWTYPGSVDGYGLGFSLLLQVDEIDLGLPGGVRGGPSPFGPRLSFLRSD